MLAARASRTENQDAIDAAIVGMLADPKEVSEYQKFSCLLRETATLFSNSSISCMKW